MRPIEEEKGKTELMEQVLRLGDRVYRMVTTTVPDNLLGLGLTCIQLKALLALSNGSLFRMADLASALGKKQKTTTGIVDRLVARGMVGRVYNANDRRVVLCKLSDKGWGAIRRIFEVQEASRNRMSCALKEMTDEDLRRTAVALREVAIHLEKESEVILVASPANKQELSTQGQKNYQVLRK